MVLFENINVNQRVEVLRDGEIYSGTVKYKGNINGISGEWVGVELDLPGRDLCARSVLSTGARTHFSSLFQYGPSNHDALSHCYVLADLK